MKALALTVVVLLVLAFGAYKQEQAPVVVSCGVAHGGTMMTAKGADWAEKAGRWLHNVADHPEQYRDPNNIRATVEGVLKDVLWFWLRAAYLGLRGEKADPEILRLHDEAARQAQQAKDLCTPCPTATGPSPLADVGNSYGSIGSAQTKQLPADELSKAVTPRPTSTVTSFMPTGSPEEIVRQAAARYFPADQVNTAVAVAHAESSLNPGARNNVQAGMLGLWQINLAAHRNLVAGKDWRDPSINAWMAYQIFHAAGDSWSPWSTYTSGSYRKYLSDGSEAATAQPVSAAGPAPGVGCQAGSMPGGGLRVATWNSYHGSVYPRTSHGNDGRVVQGMLTIAGQADIIGAQELSDSGRKAAVNSALDKIGWKVVGTTTSHPIYFDGAKFTLVSDDTESYYQRGDSVEGPDQGDRYIVIAVLRGTDGKVITVINMHQLPHIQTGNKLRDEPRRIAHAIKGWTLMAQAAKDHEAQGPVVVTGDMNYDGDPRGLYKGAGLTMASEVLGNQDTLRKREIDQILFSAGAPVSQQVLPKMGSDHSPRIVTFAGPASSAETAGATTAGARSVKDPSSGKTYTIPIPAGPRGVAINYALDQLGDPYVWGAHGPDSFDCSGLVSAAWKKAGVNFTPQTESMYRELKHTSSPQPGDLTYHPGHTQMVLPNGLILEAPRTGLTVRIVEKNWMKPTAYFDPLAGASAA